MDNTEFWAVVSRMLAVLTVGHSAMMLLSKLVGLSEAKTPKLLGKLVECSALFALVMTSTMIVSGFVHSGGAPPSVQIPELRSNAPITGALTAYFLYAGISLVAVALFYACYLITKRDRAWGYGLIPSLSGTGAVSVPAYHLLSVASPRAARFEQDAHSGLITVGVSAAALLVCRAVVLAKRRSAKRSEG